MPDITTLSDKARRLLAESEDVYRHPSTLNDLSEYNVRTRYIRQALEDDPDGNAILQELAPIFAGWSQWGGN